MPAVQPTEARERHHRLDPRRGRLVRGSGNGQREQPSVLSSEQEAVLLADRFSVEPSLFIELS